MFQVECPTCKTSRSVKAKKPWMQGEDPYLKICKSCCQTGKEKSAEHRQKLSFSVQLTQTDEVRQHKSEIQKEIYRSGKSNLIAGQGAGWNEGIQTGTPSEETREKISKSMKKRKEKHDS